MKNRESRATRLMKGFFWLMTIGVFAYFLLGEVLLSPDRDKMGIWLDFLEEYGVQVLMALLLMAAGLISVVFDIILRVFYHQKIVFGYLGWGIFLAAIWMLSESKLRQLLFTDLSLVEALAFSAVMILPIPFFIYLNSIQKGRYQKFYILVTVIFMIDFSVYAVLKMLHWDFLDRENFMDGELALAALLVLGTMGADLVKKHIREYELAAIGIAGFLLSTGIELGVLTRESYGSKGVILGLGLLFLLIMAVLKTGQDILGVEEEKQQVIRASASKEKFLANMSHEIRTPINTVIGMNEMILRENQDEEIQEYARNIQRASKMLLSLVNDILDFSKIEAGKLEIVENSYQLSSLLNDEIHVLEAKAERKNLEVRLNIDKDLPSVLKGDEIRIKQILTNLLTNAVKYTKKGQITFSVQGEWSDSGDFALRMSVADTGEGIKEEDLGKLFDSFTRLEEKKNRAIEGTGLGLNITKHLVEGMGGEIQVQSVYGKGSLFTVRIPQEVLSFQTVGDLQEAYEKEIREGITYRESFHAKEASVLAVDDNEMNLAVLKGLLKETEIRLDTVQGGEECLALCRKKKYDLILMDHMMPEPDGIETLHLLREDEKGLNMETKVIALTANALVGVKEEYVKEGFADYLSKPVEAGKLEQMLKKHLPQELVTYETVQLPKEEQTHPNELKHQKKPVSQKEEGRIDRTLGVSYCDGNEEMYLEILKVYYEQSEKYRKDLREFYEKRDWKSYEILVHALKSNSMSIGAKSFSEEAKRQEMAAKEGKEELIHQDFEKFCQDYQAVLEEVSGLLQIEETGQGASGEREEPKKRLSKEAYLEECRTLLEQVRAFEMNEALMLIERLKETEVDGEDVKEQRELLEKVRVAVDDFDYANAENCLLEWISVQTEG